MQTQRDHVHAHQFMVGRLSCALVLGDPSSAEVPARRALTGLLLGIMVVVLIAVGFGVYGWIVPGGSKAFGEKGAILVEKESGARYVYLNGVLHPTPNLASAMLIQGAQAKVKLISRNSLKDIPRGSSVGIANAPQIVPSTAELTAGPWLTCLPGSVVDNPGNALGVNLDPRAVSEPVPGDRFVLVRGPNGATFLLFRGRKHRVADATVPVALGASNVRPVQAPAMWLGWTPDGPDLAAAKIPDAGGDGPEIGGEERRIGTLFRQRPSSGEEQLFVLRPDGLAPLSRTEFLLLEATSAGTDVVELDTAAVAAAPRSPDRSLLSRLPDLSGARWQDHGDRVICLRQQPVSAAAYVGTVVLAAPDQSSIDAQGRVSVHARPASGMVVVGVPIAENGPAPKASLISDEGIAFSLDDAQTLSALKLNGSPLVPFPKELLAALPQGPLLSQKAVTGAEGR